MKKPSTPLENMCSATGSYPPSATHALLKLPRQVCIVIVMPAGFA
jgi:hypothetical protein